MSTERKLVQATTQESRVAGIALIDRTVPDGRSMTLQSTIGVFEPPSFRCETCDRLFFGSSFQQHRCLPADLKTGVA